jgi:hypothetical protein
MTVRQSVIALGRKVLGEKTVHLLRPLADVCELAPRSLGTAHGRASMKMLGSYRNRYRGERAIIIGNGPSLGETDLRLLRDEYTFGLNRVYMLFEELGFETTFLVAINELLISQVADELAAVGATKFLRWSSRGRFLNVSGDTAFLQSLRTPGFSGDVRRGVWEGATVTYVAMQLAFHMGFSKVILVGVDHNFVTSGPAHQTVESTGPDPNHFHPDYFGRGFRWQFPDLETSTLAYMLARDAYEAAGRTLVDATVGGKLDVFPKQALADALT